MKTHIKEARKTGIRDFKLFAVLITNLPDFLWLYLFLTARVHQAASTPDKKPNRCPVQLMPGI